MLFRLQIQALRFREYQFMVTCATLILSPCASNLCTQWERGPGRGRIVIKDCIGMYLHKGGELSPCKLYSPPHPFRDLLLGGSKGWASHDHGNGYCDHPLHLLQNEWGCLHVSMLPYCATHPSIIQTAVIGDCNREGFFVVVLKELLECHILFLMPSCCPSSLPLSPFQVCTLH